MIIKQQPLQQCPKLELMSEQWTNSCFGHKQITLDLKNFASFISKKSTFNKRLIRTFNFYDFWNPHSNSLTFENPHSNLLLSCERIQIQSNSTTQYIQAYQYVYKMKNVSVDGLAIAKWLRKMFLNKLSWPK